MGKDPNRAGLSRRWVLQAADESLSRLGTDHIDIYYLHKEDHATPLAETVDALGDLIRQGKIRYFGVSNYRSWRVAEICNICDRLGIDRPVVSQPYYHAMNRVPEVEHFPACSYYGLGVVPYSPLARGILTGKYRLDAAPDKESRAGRNDARMMQTEWRPESLKLAQDIRKHAEARGITAGQFAVSWVLNNSLVSAVIGGPRTEEQWDDYLGALNYRFTAEDEALIDSLVVSGHPSTPGYNDPQYPIEGRRPRTSLERASKFLPDFIVIARRRSRRSNPEATTEELDCFASLAMTSLIAPQRNETTHSGTPRNDLSSATTTASLSWCSQCPAPAMTFCSAFLKCRRMPLLAGSGAMLSPARNSNVGQAMRCRSATMVFEGQLVRRIDTLGRIVLPAQGAVGIPLHRMTRQMHRLLGGQACDSVPSCALPPLRPCGNGAASMPPSC